MRVVGALSGVDDVAGPDEGPVGVGSVKGRSAWWGGWVSGGHFSGGSGEGSSRGGPRVGSVVVEGEVRKSGRGRYQRSKVG